MYFLKTPFFGNDLASYLKMYVPPHFIVYVTNAIYTAMSTDIGRINIYFGKAQKASIWYISP